MIKFLLILIPIACISFYIGAFVKTSVHEFGHFLAIRLFSDIKVKFIRIGGDENARVLLQNKLLGTDIIITSKIFNGGITEFDVNEYYLINSPTKIFIPLGGVLFNSIVCCASLILILKLGFSISGINEFSNLIFYANTLFIMIPIYYLNLSSVILNTIIREKQESDGFYIYDCMGIKWYLCSILIICFINFIPILIFYENFSNFL